MDAVVRNALEALRAWAARTNSVRELWLFGSRATGKARPDSDVDLVIRLMPPKGNHDWAHGNYQALGDDWQRELGEIVGRHVSLEAIPPNLDDNNSIRVPAERLWARDQ
jgi:predicted nucleotidyltransferase